MKPGIERVILLLFSLFIFSPFAFSQQKPAAWNLQACINYALQNNIQIKKMQVGVRNSEINYDEAKAAVLPGLNGTVSQAFTNQAAVQGSGTNQSQSYTGNYALRSDMILYQDHKLQNTISQQELNVKSGQLNIKESENSIELAVTTAYLQILYARESVINAENSLKSSEAQLEQAKIHFDAGYIAESNYAQVQAQLSSDKYALVVANNNLNQQILTLKQLLELDIRYELDIVYPDLSDSQVLKLIPGKEQVYKTALEFMPEVANSQLSIRIADLDIQIAKSGLRPSLSLSASASTGTNTGLSSNYSTQLKNNFYQNVGLSLSIPIFDNKQAKSSVSRAMLGVETARLNSAETQKTLLKEVESVYLDAVSAQSRFQSAVELLNSAKTSYELTEDQFNLGMKNTVDLLTSKTKYLTAQQEYLQAKYNSILDYKLLDFYQNKPIEL